MPHAYFFMAVFKDEILHDIFMHRHRYIISYIILYLSLMITENEYDDSDEFLVDIF